MARSGGPGARWAYAYAIVPPQAPAQLSGLRALLAQAHVAARRGARTWTGRLVCERRVTRILVVSDSPDQRLEVNRLLEGRLRRANAAFSLTPPVALGAVT